MSDELERLRADLEVLERYSHVNQQYDDVVTHIRDKIARLEAEQADPWREAKDIINRLRENRLTLNTDIPKIVCGFFDHLTAERDRLAARVAELEAEIKAEDDADIADAEKALAEMVQANQDMGLYDAVGNPMVDDGDIPASWPLGKPDEPMLDPARVLATACELLHQLGGHWQAADARAVWRYSDLSFSAKPYRLKGGEDA